MELESIRQRSAVRRITALGFVVLLASLALMGLTQFVQAKSDVEILLQSQPSTLPQTDLAASDVFSEGFESGLGSKWVASSLINNVGWRVPLAAETITKHGGLRSAWFADPITQQYGGNCYYNPETNCPPYSGTLEYVGTPIAIPGTDRGVLMIFYSWERTEHSFGGDCYQQSTCNFDLRQVYISSTTDSNWGQPIWSTSQNLIQEQAWRPVIIDLSPYKGRAIRMRFVFNTNETPSHLNPGDTGPAYKPAGWFIDDIKIVGVNTSVYLPLIAKNR